MLPYELTDVVNIVIAVIYFVSNIVFCREEFYTLHQPNIH